MRNWREAGPGWIFVPLFLVLAIVVLLSLPAGAHTSEELAAWSRDWTARILERGESPDLFDEYRDMQDRHPCFPEECPATADRTVRIQRFGTTAAVSSGVEQWRSLVAVYFPADQIEVALRVMWCESRGDPNAYNPSGASGLMQVLSSWADNFGYSPADLFDPSINLYVASLLYYDGGWGHWRASQGCW